MLPNGDIPRELGFGSFHPRHGNLALGRWSFAIRHDNYLEFDEKYLAATIPWDMDEHDEWEEYRNARDAALVARL